MTERRRLTEAELDRLRVEVITHEEGGDLSDEPWRGEILPDRVRADPPKEFARAWVVDGIPDGYGDDIRDRHTETYQSAYYLGACYGTGTPIGSRVIDTGGLWELTHTFSGATETECPARHFDHENEEDSREPRKVTDAESQDGVCIYCEEAIGEEHRFLGDDAMVVEVWKQIDTRPDRDTMIESMARTFFVEAYASHVDECKGCFILRDIDEGDHARAGSGEDWMDVAPPLVDNNPFAEEARQLARVLAERVEKDNGADLPTLYLLASAMGDDNDHTDDPDSDDYAHYLVMQAVGHGVSWADSHPDQELKLPHCDSMYL